MTDQQRRIQSLHLLSQGFKYEFPNKVISTDQQRRIQSLHLLSQGFKYEFADKVISNERFVELVQELAANFVKENILVVNEDDQLDLAFILSETIKVSSY